MTRGHVALLALVAAGCRIPAALGPETEDDRHIPVFHFSEDQDEWLHARCAYRGLGLGAAGASMGHTRVADATLAEVLYEHDGVADLAVFACRTSPPFLAGAIVPIDPETSAPWVALLQRPAVEARATASPTSTLFVLSSTPEAPPAPADTPSPQAQTPTRRPLAPYGTAAVVVSALGLGAGAMTGLLAMGASSDVHAHCDADRVCDRQGLDAASKGPTLAAASTACFVGSGLLAASGVILLALPGKRVTAVPAQQGLGLSLQGEF